MILLAFRGIENGVNTRLVGVSLVNCIVVGKRW